MAQDGYRLDDRRFLRDMKKAEKFFTKQFPKRVYEEYKRNTPKDSGNARRHTELKKISEGFEIRGDYDYAVVLDDGLYPNPPKKGTGKTQNGYSKKAPKGMTKPTLKRAEQIANEFLRRL